MCLPKMNRELGFTFDYLNGWFESKLELSWSDFQHWMIGKTVAVDSSTKQPIYYVWDVQRYFDEKIG